MEMESMFNRELVLHNSSQGTWSVLPRQPSLVWDDSFCRVVHDTNELQIDKIMMDRNRGNHDQLLAMAASLGADIQPDNMTLQEILHIEAMYEMVNAGTRIERALNRLLWEGDPARNSESSTYREFKGFQLLSNGNLNFQDLMTDEVEYILVGHPHLFHHLDLHQIDGQPFQLVEDHDVPSISALYALPTKQGDELLTYIEYVDYSHIMDHSVSNWDDFWTDEGMYVWRIMQEKFSSKLYIKNESRLVVKRPELIIKINCTNKQDVVMDET